MTLENLIAFLRSVIYIWVGVEFSNLAYLYWYGYSKGSSPIIRILQFMVFSLSFLFLYMAFLPMLLVLDSAAHAVAVQILPIFLIPVAISARMFRSESLKKQTMKLLEKKNESTTADRKEE